MESRWIGIDLGTYNSSAAWKSASGGIETVRAEATTREGEDVWLEEKERSKEFPSFIYFNQDGSVAGVGTAAKKRAHADPEYVVWGIKRLLGRTYSDLRDSGELERFQYRIKPDRRTGQCLISIGERTYTPIELCAEILKEIKRSAERQGVTKADCAVISVPAYYDPLRVTPIVEAARLAGFAQVKTIPEPVAAALSYKAEISTRSTKVLVFDLGAGTLDVTAGHLYRHPDRVDEFAFEVLKNTGDTRLGGIDMDDRLSQLIQGKCEIRDAGVATRSKLQRIAEIAKIELSYKPRVPVQFEIEDKSYHCFVDHLELKAVLEGAGPEKNLLDECRRQITDAIYGASWVPEQVEVLVPIGGPTRLPCVGEVLRIAFHSNPRVLQQLEAFYSDKEDVDPMTAVSSGAVLSLDRTIQDKVPYGYGIEEIDFTKEGRIYRANVLIRRDTPYPFKGEQYILGWQKFDGRYELKLLQQLPEAEVKESGGEFRFVGVYKFAVKDPESCSIAVQMGYNENRELEVNIRNLHSTEAVPFLGIPQITSMSVKYPIIVKMSRRAGAGGGGGGGGGGQEAPQEPSKRSPSPEAVDKFMEWAKVTVGFVRRKVDNHPIRQMLLAQLVDEASRLLQSDVGSREYVAVYNKLNSLLWNAQTMAVLTKEEFEDLSRPLKEHEDQLFRIG